MNFGWATINAKGDLDQFRKDSQTACIKSIGSRYIHINWFGYFDDILSRKIV